MPDRTLQALADSSSARLAGYIDRYISRSRRDGPIDEGDHLRINWLIAQLLTSKYGALELLPDGTKPDTPDAVAPGLEDSTFSQRRDLFQAFTHYSGVQDPHRHAEWVDQLVQVLAKLRDNGWGGLTEDDQRVVEEKLIPLLRRLRGLNTRSIDRDAPFAAV